MIGGALGECVHVAGIAHVLRLAEELGWHTVFLGPAVSINEFITAIREHDPELVAVSYRLTPETAESLLRAFQEAVIKNGLDDRRYAFGGTPPVVEHARRLALFEACFSGEEPIEEVIAYLKGEQVQQPGEEAYPQTLVERIRWKAPYPIIRHHFGLPTVEATIEGIEKIAESRVLDVISLGTDQDAQENFFHPERQDPRRKGAGGVPVRSAEDFRRLYAASRRGNYPLMRTYTGTDDFIRLAEIYVETIHIAWAAIPLFWFNQLDGRGPWDLEGSLREHQKLMRWYAERDIPVEVNEPHHWGLRDAPDVIYVVASYLSAYNARAMGVKDYVAQYMFNSPAGLSDRMDLAKILACIEMSESLAGPDFRVYRQTRTGLLSYPVEPAAARGHLAASVYLQMAVQPHIMHVVAATEADHATTAEELIESVRIARRAIENALRGAPDMTADPIVQARKEKLIAEAQVTLEAIRDLAGPDVEDPLADPATLTRAVTTGILDAPHLRGSPIARGQIVTRIIDGRCEAVDPETGEPLREAERIARLKKGGVYEE
ncbi:MAG TPA: methionine synthase [Caldilineae bacterium]|nr:methionine synthase [Caldilineae bacterium]